MTTKPNITEADELAEIKRLLIQAITDGLKAKEPKASLLDVAMRFLKENPATGATPSATSGTPKALDLPFPVKREETVKATDLPFPAPIKATEEAWKPIDNQPFKAPEFDAPKLPG